MKISKKKNVGVVRSKSGFSFRVWAPNASQVYMTGTFNNWSKEPMLNEEDGYWHLMSKNAKEGQEYKFVIENGEKEIFHNDPRSMHFTTSTGSSVIYINNFDWEGDSYIPPPINEQVIYELHIGTFNRPDPAINGTFESAIDKLDFLKKLGVTTIELMPINTMILDRGWGYGIDYIFAVESLYGGHYGFKKFIKEAHKRNMGVVLDVVYNHLGPDTSLDLWQFDGWSENNLGGIYFYNDWRAETPWGNTRPDYGRPEIHQYILDNVRMLIHDCHLDGLRVDSTIYIRNVKGRDSDSSTDLPEGWELLQNINRVTKEINPRTITIAEDIGCNEYITKQLSDGGAGFTSQWDLVGPSVFRNALSNDSPEKINLAEIITMMNKRFNDDPFQRVIYLDSHDSAANGSTRFVTDISPKDTNSYFARKQSLIAATLQLTLPGMPMLFQGQEFLETGEFNDWRGLDWSKTLIKSNQGVIDAYRKLIELRRNYFGHTKGLTGKNCNLLNYDETNKVISYHRWFDGGHGDDVVVVINFGNRDFDEYTLNLPYDGEWRVAFCSTDNKYVKESKKIKSEIVHVQHGSTSIKLPQSCSLVLTR